MASTSSKRGPLSCAECRRLKLKCDRKVPCGTCTKRGCSQICPNGTLTTGAGTRLILSDTSQLHKSIDRLTKRTQDLEAALASLHAQNSNETHPLLLPELLQSKGEDDPHPQDDTLDNFGTLALRSDGETFFLGPTAGSEYLLQDDDLPPSGTSSSTKAINAIHGDQATDLEWLEKKSRLFLPTFEVAFAMSENFYKYVGWLTAPISRDFYMRETLEPIYRAEPSSRLSVHHLALLFITIALGILFDPERPPFSTDASHFYKLAGTILNSGRDYLWNQGTLVTVAGLHLMSIYDQFSDMQEGVTNGWYLGGNAARVMQRMGLHRDSARFELDAQEVDNRRRVFWEVFSYDIWQSFTTGRPPSISRLHFDTEFPKALPSDMFYSVRSTYIRDVLAEVIDRAFSATPPKYSDILRLDHKARTWPLPSWLEPNNDAARAELPNVFPHVDLKFLATCMVWQMNWTLLYLHRPWFARAMMETPTDPLASKWAPSIIATHRCACALVKLHGDICRQAPIIAPRMFMWWGHTITSCMALSAIVTLAPHCNLAPSALKYVDIAYALMQEGEGRRCARAMPTLKRLRENSHQAFSRFRAGSRTGPQAHTSSRPTSPAQRLESSLLSPSPGPSSSSYTSPSSPSAYSWRPEQALSVALSRVGDEEQLTQDFFTLAPPSELGQGSQGLGSEEQRVGLAEDLAWRSFMAQLGL